MLLQDVDDNLNQIQDLYMSVTKLYTKSSTTSTVELPPPISASEALIVNALCALGLAFAFWIANTVYSIELVTHPSLTLFFIWVLSIQFSFRFLLFIVPFSFSHSAASFRLQSSPL